MKYSIIIISFITILVVLNISNSVYASDISRFINDESKVIKNNYINLDYAKKLGLVVKPTDRLKLNRIDYTLLRDVYSKKEGETTSFDKEVGEYFGRKLYINDELLKKAKNKNPKDNNEEDEEQKIANFYVRNELTGLIGYVDGAMILKVNNGEDYKLVISEYPVRLRKYYSSTKVILVHINQDSDLLTTFNNIKQDERVKSVELNIYDSQISVF